MFNQQMVNSLYTGSKQFHLDLRNWHSSFAMGSLKQDLDTKFVVGKSESKLYQKKKPIGVE